MMQIVNEFLALATPFFMVVGAVYLIIVCMRDRPGKSAVHVRTPLSKIYSAHNPKNGHREFLGFVQDATLSGYTVEEISRFLCSIEALEK